MQEQRKTPGQVAFEAHGNLAVDYGKLFPQERERWERAADAVVSNHLRLPIGIGDKPPPPPPPPPAAPPMDG